MSALPSNVSSVLTSIRHAIQRGRRAGCCALCGNAVSAAAARRWARPLCRRCQSSPDDTGPCSFCGAYGPIEQLTLGGAASCDRCLDAEIQAAGEEVAR